MGIHLLPLALLLLLVGTTLGLIPAPQHQKCKNLSETYPKQYVAYKTFAPPEIDGDLEEAAWSEVAWTDPFFDIQGNSNGHELPRFDTRVKMRWDDTFLYIAAHLQETQVWANITKGPDVIFHDNDFEVFVDPAGSNHHYKEFEINANCAKWALCLNKPYSDGGYENSTRVFPGHGFDMPSIKAAIYIDGVINDPSVPSRSWTVEAAIPLSDLALNSTSTRSPPAMGDLWRINFSRVEWRVAVVGGKYEKLPGPEDNWVWSPQGAINMHSPERWGYLQFAEGLVNVTLPTRDTSWVVRECAMEVYRGQQRHKEIFGFYAADPAQLLDLVDRPEAIDGTCSKNPSITVNADGFVAQIASAGGKYLAFITEDRFLQVTRTPAQPGETFRARLLA